MNKGIISLLIVVLGMGFWTNLWSVSIQRAEYGQQLAEMQFAVPEDQQARDYLGLKGKGDVFKIPEIDAQVVIVEIFSMYCPHCQKQAPAVNDLFAVIQNQSGLKGKVKIVGMGVGNSAFEVGIFKKQYAIPFPLIPDEKQAIVNTLSGVVTPWFIGYRFNKDGSYNVFYSKPGGFSNEKEFLATMLELSGFPAGGGS